MNIVEFAAHLDGMEIVLSRSSLDETATTMFVWNKSLTVNVWYVSGFSDPVLTDCFTMGGDGNNTTHIEDVRTVCLAHYGTGGAMENY